MPANSRWDLIRVLKGYDRERQMVPLYTIKSRSFVMFRISLVGSEERFKVLEGS